VGERHRLSDPVPERLGSLTVGLLKSARYFRAMAHRRDPRAHTRGMRSRGTGTTRALPGSPFNQPPAVAIVASYAMSDRVSHDRYGLGTVVGAENGNAAVLVNFGPKVLRVALPTTKMVKL